MDGEEGGTGNGLAVSVCAGPSVWFINEVGIIEPHFKDKKMGDQS